MDYEKELEEFKNDDSKRKEFELPDGQKIKIGDVCIKTPECLIKPEMLGLDVPGIH